MGNKVKTAITPTRVDDYPEWYQQVIKAADLLSSVQQNLQKKKKIVRYNVPVNAPS